MATYCSVRDVRLALTPNAEEDGVETGAALPDWQITDAIDEAEGFINAFLIPKYVITPVEITVPDPEHEGQDFEDFFAAPAPVRGWTRTVAAYLCALTFRKHKDLTDDDPIVRRFKMVLGLLTDVRDGKTQLPLPENDDPSQGVYVENLYEPAMFALEDVGLAVDGRHVQRLWPARLDVY